MKEKYGKNLQKDCYEGIGKFYVFQKVQVNL